MTKTLTPLEALEMLADGGEIIESSGSSGEMTISDPDGDEHVFKFSALSAEPVACTQEPYAYVAQTVGGGERLLSAHDARHYVERDANLKPLFTSPPDQSARIEELTSERDFYKTNLELADAHAKEVLRPKIKELEKEVERLTVDNLAFRRVHRWSTDRDGGHLMVCRNEHEKGEACEWERFYPPETIADLRARLAKAVEVMKPVAEEAWRLEAGYDGTLPDRVLRPTLTDQELSDIAKFVKEQEG